jgi:hypothetical protein
MSAVPPAPIVPPVPTEPTRADPEPETPGPHSGLPGAGTARTGDSTESFASVDPEAEQRSFPRSSPGGGSFPASRPRTDEEAFRLFPPVRRTGNDPPAPPATDDQD